jgi:hypothetical protein
MQVQLQLGAATRVAPQCSSAAMSFQSAIPWRVAPGRVCLRFTEWWPFSTLSKGFVVLLAV